MNKPVLTGMALSIMLLLSISCGNLVNDELQNDNSEPALVEPGDDIPVPGDDIPIPGVDRFGTIVEGEFSTSGKVVIRSTGGDGYFLSATAKDANGRDTLWLSYTDKFAVRKWSAILENFDTDDRISRIEVLDKDNILIFADRYYSNTPTINPDVIIIKVNSSDGILWQKCIGNDEKNIVYGTALADDGGFLATGITVIEKTDTTPAEFIPYVVRSDCDGNIIWKKDYQNFFNIARPTEIINLGNDEYLISGTATNPDTNKITGFYCRIDGALEIKGSSGGGKILKSRYVKSSDSNISMLGSISNGDNITSVITLKGDSSEQFSILSMDKKKLKVSSRKSYSFSDFNLQGDIINVKSDGFVLAGMIKYLIGKGLYTVRFDMTGALKELQTKYYDNSGYKFLNPEFSKINNDSGITFVSRLDNPGENKYLFMDKFETSTDKLTAKSKVEVIVTDGSENDNIGLDEQDVEAEITESVLTDKTDPGLLFKKY